MRGYAVVCLFALPPLLGGCEPIAGVGQNLSERSSNEGVGVFLAWLSSDSTFYPSNAQLAVSADARTLYFAGRSQDRADSSIYAYDVESGFLRAIVPKASGLGRIVSLPGDDILYSLATGEIRRAGRDRVGSEATPAVAAGGPDTAFVVSPNGRFIFRRIADQRSEVVDLATGNTATIDLNPVAVMAVRNDGDEVVYRDEPNRYERVAIRRLSTNAVRSFELAKPPDANVYVLSAAWVGDTLLALTYERLLVGNSFAAPVITEVDVNRGASRVLGQEQVPAGWPLGWAPNAHRAAALYQFACRTEYSGGDCLMYYYDLIDLNTPARKVGRLYSSTAVRTAVLSPDGRMLIYMAGRLMIKTL